MASQLAKEKELISTGQRIAQSFYALACETIVRINSKECYRPELS